MAYVRRPFNPLTPTPNQVVNELNQANENFDILAQAFLNNDPTTRVLKSDVYTFRRVDLTNAMSDYMLQVGEEAIISFEYEEYEVFIPLRISTQSGTYYEMDMIFLNYSNSLVSIHLYPNNMSYANAFIFRKISSSGFSQVRNSYFEIFSGSGNASIRAYITNFNWFKVVSVISSEPTLYVSLWDDRAIRWTSLGTVYIYCNYPHYAGYILVRRLL